MDLRERPDYLFIVRKSRGRFEERLRLAVWLLLNGFEGEREFDNCFEASDGTAVVLGVARLAEEHAAHGDDRLTRLIADRRSLKPPLPWRAFPEHFSHVRDLKAFAAACGGTFAERDHAQMHLNLD